MDFNAGMRVNVWGAKGVTPIISVVLLLMMSVAIAGIAWFWMQSTATNVMDTTSNATNLQLKQMLSIIDVAEYDVDCAFSPPAPEDANTSEPINISFQIYNRGSSALELQSILLNGKVATSTPAQLPLAPGKLGTLKVIGAQSQIPGLTNSVSKEVEVKVASSTGYNKKSMRIDGSRCNDNQAPRLPAQVTYQYDPTSVPPSLAFGVKNVGASPFVINTMYINKSSVWSGTRNVNSGVQTGFSFSATGALDVASGPKIIDIVFYGPNGFYSKKGAVVTNTASETPL